MIEFTVREIEHNSVRMSFCRFVMIDAKVWDLVKPFQIPETEKSDWMFLVDWNLFLAAKNL